MSEFRAELRSLAAGSLPHPDPKSACQLALQAVEIPTWPQLPRRSFLENMYVQYSERFPGAIVDDGRVFVDSNGGLDGDLERLYLASLMDDLDHGIISPAYAAGLYEFLNLDLNGTAVVKGQITGPVSWGLMVTDQDRRPVLYDEVLAEAVAKHLRLKASWSELQLRRTAPQTIVFLDEPYMSSYGSAFVSLKPDQVYALMEEVLSGIKGLKGVHCCGNTDWSLLLSTTLDILNIDAYGYAHTLALYPDEVGAFLERGGIIAWGIVPASREVQEETVSSLVDCFHHALNLLTSKGIHQDDLLSAALIMPSCGCGSLEIATAERTLEMTGAVAKALQERYA